MFKNTSIIHETLCSEFVFMKYTSISCELFMCRNFDRLSNTNVRTKKRVFDKHYDADN